MSTAPRLPAPLSLACFHWCASLGGRDAASGPPPATNRSASHKQICSHKNSCLCLQQQTAEQLSCCLWPSNSRELLSFNDNDILQCNIGAADFERPARGALQRRRSRGYAFYTKETRLRSECILNRNGAADRWGETSQLSDAVTPRGQATKVLGSGASNLEAGQASTGCRALRSRARRSDAACVPECRSTGGALRCKHSDMHSKGSLSCHERCQWGAWVA